MFFFFQAEDGIRDKLVTGVQTCALPILAVQERRGAGSPDLASTLTNLGVVARKQGDLAAAREYYRRALVVRERLAPDSLTVAANLGNFGDVASDQGGLAAAEEPYQPALAIREKTAPQARDQAA